MNVTIPMAVFAVIQAAIFMWIGYNLGRMRDNK